MTNKTPALLSKTISYALHPIIIPTIGVAVLLFGKSVMSAVTIDAKWFLLAMVLMNTAVIPALIIGLLRYFGIIPDLSLKKRGERIIPMAIIALSYIVCAFMLKDMMMAFLIRRFLMCALCCVIFAGTVTFFWHISLHMTAIGGLLGVLLIMTFSHFGQFTYVVIVSILLCGLLASARLYLGKHDIAQVSVGFCGGLLVSAAALLLL